MKPVKSSEIHQLLSLINRSVLDVTKIHMFSTHDTLLEYPELTDQYDDFTHIHASSLYCAVIEVVLSLSGNNDTLTIDLDEILEILLADVNSLYDAYSDDSLDLFEEQIGADAAGQLGFDIIQGLLDTVRCSFESNQEQWEKVLLDAITATSDLLEAFNGVSLWLNMESLMHAAYDGDVFIITTDDLELRTTFTAEYSDTLEELLQEHDDVTDEMFQDGGIVTVNGTKVHYRPGRECRAGNHNHINVGDTVGIYILKDQV